MDSVYPDFEPWKPLKIGGSNHNFSGRLIVFEGVDGSGKTTQIETLLQTYRAIGKKYLFTKTPTPELREFSEWKKYYSDEDRDRGIGFGLGVMALGDRFIHQRRVVIPALQEGMDVITDRYILTSLIHDSSPAHEYVLNLLLRPSLGIFCDASEEIILKRLKARDFEKTSGVELTSIGVQIRRMRQLASLHGFVVVPTATDPEGASKLVWNAVNSLEIALP